MSINMNVVVVAVLLVAVAQLEPLGAEAMQLRESHVLVHGNHPKSNGESNNDGIHGGYKNAIYSQEGVWVPVDAVMANPKGLFGLWVQGVSKVYETVEEYEKRFGVWMDNLKYVVEYNSKHSSHWLGMNHFADLTHEEWKNVVRFGYRGERDMNAVKNEAPFRYKDSEMPEIVDWREKNAVARVKNQQMCGSCWAFSTTGAIEGINAIKTGRLVALSEQMLVDCDTSRDHGCHGGLMDFAFDFVLENGGIDTEESYPYKAEEGQCDVNRRDRHVVTIDGHEDVPPNDEVSLMKAVANQPVSAAIEADQRSFQLYGGGVFDAECGTELNHGVLIVGYGTAKNGTREMPYWIIKNSWGPTWGDKGYIRIRRNAEAAEGQCGVAMQASFPIKNGPNPPEPPPAPPAPPPVPPTPEPVDCDGVVECPPQTTCCCMKELFGYCYTWACCPLPEATCCDDHIHCCPSDLPVCNVEEGTCSKGAGYAAETVAMVTKVNASPKRKSQGSIRSIVV